MQNFVWCSGYLVDLRSISIKHQTQNRYHSIALAAAGVEDSVL